MAFHCLLVAQMVSPQTLDLTGLLFALNLLLVGKGRPTRTGKAKGGLDLLKLHFT